MTVYERITQLATEATEAADRQEWATARGHLAKTAEYLLPLELVQLDEENRELGDQAWDSLREATQHVADKYTQAFPAK